MPNSCARCLESFQNTPWHLQGSLSLAGPPPYQKASLDCFPSLSPYMPPYIWSSFGPIKKPQKDVPPLAARLAYPNMDLASGLCALRFPEVCSEQRAMAHLDKYACILTQTRGKYQRI